MIRTARLDSRSQVILESVEHTEVASLGLWNFHGSRDEAAAEVGCSHFLEHMLFKGTGRRSAFQIAQEIERVGGYLNAFTEKEVTCFHCTLPAAEVALAVDVLTDMYFHSTLDPLEIEKEKAVVLNEIQAAEDSPEEKAHQLYIEGLWDGHTLSRKITGESRDVQAITPATLERLYRRFYTPESTVITASGDLEPQALLEDLNRRFAAGTPSGLTSRPADAEAAASEARRPPVRRRSWELKPDKFEQVQLYTGVSYPGARAASEYYQDLVFNTLFGESMSSRLFQRLREDKGLCYTVYSFRSYFTDASLWTIYANTAPAALTALLDGLDAELGRLRSQPPTAKEVEDAKSQIRGGMILAKEDMENRMKRLFRMYHLTDRVAEQEESLALLADVSRDDVIGFSQRLQPEAFNLMAYGSRGAKKMKRKTFSF